MLRLGGLCRTFRHGEHRYDSGAHRFHDRDQEITADVRALLGPELQPMRAASHIYDRGRLLEFPPSPLGWVRGRGMMEAARVAADVLGSRWRARPERTFEDLAINRYGRRLGKPLLLDYLEKLWGLPAAASRRLSGLSVAALLVEALRPRQHAAHPRRRVLVPPERLRCDRGGARGRAPRRDGAARSWDRRSRLRGESGGTLRFAARSDIAVDGRVASTLPLTHVERLEGGGRRRRRVGV